MKHKLNFLSNLIGRAAVLGVVVIGPWRNGSTEPDVMRTLFLCVIASGIAALVSLWTAPERERRTNEYRPALWIALPLMLALALSVFQLIPLPGELVGTLSPNIPKLKTALLPPEIDGLTLDGLYGKGPNVEEFSVEQRKARSKALKARAAEQIDASKEEVEKFLGQTFEHDADGFNLTRAITLDAAAERQFLGAGFDSRDSGLNEWGRMLSVYPLAGREGLPLFWCALILFLSTAALFNTTESRRVLLCAAVVNGVAFAMLAVTGRANPGFVDRLVKYLDFWWLEKTKINYGTYVNKNSAGGYLVMIFCASLFFLARAFMMTAREKSADVRERRRDEKEMKEQSKKSGFKVKKEAKWKAVLGDFFDLYNKRIVGWLCVSAFLFAAILASLSRGASIAAVASLLALLIVFFVRCETRRYWHIPVVAVILAGVALGSVDLSSAVDDRMSTVVEENGQGENIIQRDMRWTNWQNAIAAWKDYPVFGAGLGAYSQAIYRYDTALKADRLFYYPENIFIQTLLELGAIGLTLLFVVYAMLLVRSFALLIGLRSTETKALGIFAVALFLGHVVSSSCDFGIYHPGNLFLFVVLYATVLGRQNRRAWDNIDQAIGRKNRSLAEKASEEAKRLMKRERRGLVAVTVLMILALAPGKLILAENQDYIKRTTMLRAAQFNPDELGLRSAAALNKTYSKLRQYAARRDDCYEVRIALAKLAVVRYRLGFLEKLQKERPDESSEKLWEETAPDRFIEAFLQYQSMNFSVAVDNFRTRYEPAVSAFRSAATDLYAARRICPLYARTTAPLVGFVAVSSDATWEDERHLLRLYALRQSVAAPYDVREFLRFAPYLGCFGEERLRLDFLRRAVAFRPLAASTALSLLLARTPSDKLVDSVDYVVSDKMPAIWRALYDLRTMKSSPVYGALIEKFRKLYAEAPEEARDYAFWYYSGMCFDMTRDYESALDALQHAIEKDESGADSAFFLRINIMMRRSALLQRDEECVRALEEYVARHRGAKKWRAEDLLEKARETLVRSEARKRARENARLEMEENRQRIDGSSSAPEPDAADIQDSFEETDDEDLFDSFEPAAESLPKRGGVSSAIDEIERQMTAP